MTGEILRLLGLRLTTRDGTTRRWRCSVARVKAGCGQQVQISERPQQWPTHLVARSTMRALTVPHSSTPHEALSRAPGCAARACANHASLDAPLDGGRPDRSIVGGGRKMAALGIDWSSSRLETLVRLARAQSVSGSIPSYSSRQMCHKVQPSWGLIRQLLKMPVLDLVLYLFFTTNAMKKRKNRVTQSRTEIMRFSRLIG